MNASYNQQARNPVDPQQEIAEKYTRLIQLYKMNPAAFTEDEVYELKQYADSLGMKMDIPFSATRAAKAALGGFFDTLSFGLLPDDLLTKPLNTGESIAEMVGGIGSAFVPVVGSASLGSRIAGLAGKKILPGLVAKGAAPLAEAAAGAAAEAGAVAKTGKAISGLWSKFGSGLQTLDGQQKFLGAVGGAATGLLGTQPFEGPNIPATLLGGAIGRYAPGMFARSLNGKAMTATEAMPKAATGATGAMPKAATGAISETSPAVTAGPVPATVSEATVPNVAKSANSANPATTAAVTPTETVAKAAQKIKFADPKTQKFVDDNREVLAAIHNLKNLRVIENARLGAMQPTVMKIVKAINKGSKEEVAEALTALSKIKNRTEVLKKIDAAIKSPATGPAVAPVTPISKIADEMKTLPSGVYQGNNLSNATFDEVQELIRKSGVRDDIAGQMTALMSGKERQAVLLGGHADPAVLPPSRFEELKARATKLVEERASAKTTAPTSKIPGEIEPPPYYDPKKATKSVITKQPPKTTKSMDERPPVGEKKQILQNSELTRSERLLNSMRKQYTSPEQVVSDFQTLGTYMSRDGRLLINDADATRQLYLRLLEMKKSGAFPSEWTEAQKEFLTKIKQAIKL